MPRNLRVIVLCLCFCAAASLAQVKAEAAAPPDVPTITFTFDFPQSAPDHYSLVVDSSGHATYISGLDKPSSNATSDSDSESTTSSDQPFHFEFTLSPATRARIFNLAERAHYFQGNLNYGKHNVASTGNKTLSYKDAHRTTSATYNYTTNQPAQQLTALFQNLSTTLEFGRRLQYLHHYQKLALEEEMKRMEEMAKDNSLEELQAVAPILKQILADQSVINVTRARAERLLARSATAR